MDIEPTEKEIAYRLATMLGWDRGTIKAGDGGSLYWFDKPGNPPVLSVKEWNPAVNVDQAIRVAEKIGGSTFVQLGGTREWSVGLDERGAIALGKELAPTICKALLIWSKWKFEKGEKLWT